MSVDLKAVQLFVEVYLRPLHKTHKKQGRIEIDRPGVRVENAPFYLLGGDCQYLCVNSKLLT